jgi:quinol monooxygenase YgiN
MILVAGTIRIAADKQTVLQPAALTMIEKTRAEEGCFVYSFGWDMVEPGLIRIYEEWQSQAHLDAHIATDHMADWRAALGEVGVLGRDVKIFEAEQVGSV